ncbi:DUF4974 domain-containing protein [Chitinophaga lutea]|uniref:DUF4974 domain-containing protein n=1 Tax=Chitinophaga lutea TaxID=2488634 RepID=A0A3N4QRL8_9BACT|nr:FecR family protein [Chitinophaga lutea]RPE14224.1 DUF4974 domain-containing protein [Chitinophaga lutea]
MTKEEALQFIRKFRSGQYAPEEHAAFREWLNSLPAEETEELMADFAHPFLAEEAPAVAPELSWQRIEARIRPVQRRRWPLYAAAAAVLGIIAAASVWLMQPVPGKIQPTQATVHTVQPAANKAVLTLGDGSLITLDSAANGQLARQGQTSVLKSGTGQLQYDQQGPEDAVQFNTLATPRGGQFQLVLPDGSKVWLNAASSLRFPTAFHGTERRVELQGEAYFEIAHNKKMPFRVTTANDLTITVLGTHFNVMAYADESSLKTTLLEGSVQLNRGGTTQLLKPGQEGRLHKQSGTLSVAPADVEEAIAWKNGIFQFEHADITAIARQLARWYDVDVVIAGPLPQKNFVGVMSRNAPLESVLKVLGSTGVQFKLEGRRLIVTP